MYVCNMYMCIDNDYLYLKIIKSTYNIYYSIGTISFSIEAHIQYNTTYGVNINIFIQEKISMVFCQTKRHFTFMMQTF